MLCDAALAVQAHRFARITILLLLPPLLLLRHGASKQGWL
jgi:hypothetical protein